MDPYGGIARKLCLHVSAGGVDHQVWSGARDGERGLTVVTGRTEQGNGDAMARGDGSCSTSGRLAPRTLRPHAGVGGRASTMRFRGQRGERWPGVMVARVGVRIGPMIAVWDAEIFEYLTEESGIDLYPVGEADRSNTYLAIARCGLLRDGQRRALGRNGRPSIGKARPGHTLGSARLDPAQEAVMGR